MIRKIMSCFLAGLCVLLSVLGCIPMRGYAVVPLSLVESALASYTVSAGYKWYSDGSASEMSQSITNLYNTWYDAVGKNIDGVLTLAQFAAGYGLPLDSRGYVYLDNSGQIVITKVAADVFQQFSDWIETEYSVTIGSDTPTQVISGVTSDSFSDGNGVQARLFTANTADELYNTSGNSLGAHYFSSVPIGLYNGYDCYLMAEVPASIYLTFYNNRMYGRSSDEVVFSTALRQGSQFVFSAVTFGPEANELGKWFNTYVNYTDKFSLVPTSSVNPLNFASAALSPDASGVASLGVTLAQAVADVVGQAQDDDAVVIGVGAGVGATAQDIAGLVADGIKAGTLEPSVSITAEAVIDTPVQPFPDIDGLGLPSLGAELVNRFPFCIPWDFVDIVRLFAAEPVAPRFQFDIVPDRVKAFCSISQSTSIDLNMGDSKFEKIGVFCRWGSLIGFCWGLVMLTKRMIWTA